MKPLDRLGGRERVVIEARRAHGYHISELEHFGAELEAVLRALLARLLPGVPTGIDLAGFIDSHAGNPLGRGDRPPGVPPETELFTAGLHSLDQLGFATWSTEEQDRLIGRMRNGDADTELGLPAREFIDRLLNKALTGYLAHPDTWIRIGFTGPAYPDGYAWIGPAEAIARHRQVPGWASL